MSEFVHKIILFGRKSMDYAEGFEDGFCDTLSHPVDTYKNRIRKNKIKDLVKDAFEINAYVTQYFIRSRHKLTSREEYTKGYHRGIFDGYLMTFCLAGVGNLCTRLIENIETEKANEIAGFHPRGYTNKSSDPTLNF